MPISSAVFIFMRMYTFESSRSPTCSNTLVPWRPDIQFFYDNFGELAVPVTHKLIYSHSNCDTWGSSNRDAFSDTAMVQLPRKCYWRLQKIHPDGHTYHMIHKIIHIWMHKWHHISIWHLKHLSHQLCNTDAPTHLHLQFWFAMNEIHDSSHHSQLNRLHFYLSRAISS